mmetsp:Transcript_21176/g.68307  ORF Transcript_21176/g.68307 Transcript_21176/m.68307 type:complete len:234 (+) Transcript_21176:223-924(+)
MRQGGKKDERQGRFDGWRRSGGRGARAGVHGNLPWIVRAAVARRLGRVRGTAAAARGRVGRHLAARGIGGDLGRRRRGPPLRVELRRRRVLGAPWLRRDRRPRAPRRPGPRVPRAPARRRRTGHPPALGPHRRPSQLQDLQATSPRPPPRFGDRPRLGAPGLPRRFERRTAKGATRLVPSRRSSDGCGHGSPGHGGERRQHQKTRRRRQRDYWFRRQEEGRQLRSFLRKRPPV